MEGKISATFDGSHLQTLNIELTGLPMEELTIITMQRTDGKIQDVSWPLNLSSQTNKAWEQAIQILSEYAEKKLAGNEDPLAPNDITEKALPILANLQMRFVFQYVDGYQKLTGPQQAIFILATQSFSENVVSDQLLDEISLVLYTSFYSNQVKKAIHRRQTFQYNEDVKNEGDNQGEADQKLAFSGDSSENSDQDALQIDPECDGKGQSMDAAVPQKKVIAVSDLDPDDSFGSGASVNSELKSDEKSESEQSERNEMNESVLKSDDGVEEEEKQTHVM